MRMHACRLVTNILLLGWLIAFSALLILFAQTKQRQQPANSHSAGANTTQTTTPSALTPGSAATRRSDATTISQRVAHKSYLSLNESSKLLKNDVCITVKTTRSHHATHLHRVTSTWFRAAPNQTYFFTDGDDPVYSNKTNNHLVNTGCQNSDSDDAFDRSCQIGAQFSFFRTECRAKWWCLYEDTSAVDVDGLYAKLSAFDSGRRYYVGEANGSKTTVAFRKELVRFRYAVAETGICMSEKLVDVLAPHFEAGLFEETAEQVNRTEFETLGLLVAYYGHVYLVPERPDRVERRLLDTPSFPKWKRYVEKQTKL